MPELTEEELKVIEERVNAATPGPWTVTFRDRYFVIESPSRIEYPGNFVINFITIRRTSSLLFTEQEVAGNAALVAAARTDIPALIAEVRALRAARDADLVAIENIV